MKFPEPLEELPSPSQDLTQRHAGDQRIRRYGFHIHGRPNGKEATWERGGKLFGQAEVLWMIAERERAKKGAA